MKCLQNYGRRSGYTCEESSDGSDLRVSRSHGVDRIVILQEVEGRGEHITSGASLPTTRRSHAPLSCSLNSNLWPVNDASQSPRALQVRFEVARALQTKNTAFLCI